jgi:hypothetical protein
MDRPYVLNVEAGRAEARVTGPLAPLFAQVRKSPRASGATCKRSY